MTKNKPTIAALKRLLSKGQRWHCLHEFPDKGTSKHLGTRTLAHLDTVKFGFQMQGTDTPDRISYSDFPKAQYLTELTPTRFVIDKGWVRLTYSLSRLA